MAAAGLAADLIEEGDFAYASGQAAALNLLVREPTAIFAANDQMALGVLAACRAAGVSVPGDVSVVGFGNTSAAEHSVPALTAVSMPRHQLGVEAMQAVVDALALEQPRVFPRRLPYHLVIRESSGPPSRVQPVRVARRSRNSDAGRIKTYLGCIREGPAAFLGGNVRRVHRADRVQPERSV